MAQLATLLDAIRRAPADDELRLVYADALEQAGELRRAELIRTQLAGTPEAARRAQELLAAHGKELAGAAGEHARTWRFDRGLVVEAVAEATVWIEHGAKMIAAAPIAEAGIRNDRDAEWEAVDVARELAACAWLRHVRRVMIGLYDPFADPAAMETLARSPHLVQLTHVDVGYPDALAAAARCPPQLTEARVYCEGATSGDAALAALASRQPKLERLQIMGCGVTVAGAHAIAAAPWPLRFLAFGGTHYQVDALGEAGVRALAQSPRLARLEVLGLEATSLDDAAVAALAASPHLRALRRLDLGDNAAVTDAAMAALAASPVLASIRELSVQSTAVTEQGIALVKSAHPELAIVPTGTGQWFGYL